MTLGEGDYVRACATRLTRSGALQQLRLMATAEGPGSGSEAHAHGPGEAEHPLPDGGDVGNDVIDEMRGGLDHAPSPADASLSDHCVLRTRQVHPIGAAASVPDGVRPALAQQTR